MPCGISPGAMLRNRTGQHPNHLAAPFRAPPTSIPGLGVRLQSSALGVSVKPMSPPRVFSASDTFATLDGTGEVQTHAVSPEFWSQLSSGERVLPGPYLMSFGTSSADWPHWEMHPSGEEVVMLIAGAGDFVMRLPGGDQRLSLRQAGDYVVVPRGTWHTFRNAGGDPATLLFITSGEGTTHSKQPPAP